ncbi:low temperature requirement protein A [Saccharothrix violaceirubra]|uniref:Low temperature requirement protein LtrA n=1 Tax=Saccharothrix violaceirubra TaxID=413306 RepID=A0A7W7WYP9_9PSEU|nr:low temperature requirement protein A [Saccharothrix violaceirubra]MBB4968779.1 low temperature requirement protein LtrA [Saccharothrix violaceirubra]
MITPRVVREGARVTPLELFFDLVFVYAITQVTQLMAADASVHGVLRGLLLLAILWWCWCCYSWLGNRVRADDDGVRVVLFAAMAVMLVAAVAIPEAFDDLPGGLSGPLVFAACYVVVRVLHLVAYWRFSVGDVPLRRQLAVTLAPMLSGSVLLVVAAFTSGATQTALWVAALVVDYGGVLVTGVSGWRVHSAVHFAERYGLIVLIALGESIVAVGVGVADLPVSWPIMFGIGCGLVVAAALWWAYFDVDAPLAERVLHQAAGAKRAALARDAFTYLHLPMIAGIVLSALGLKKTMNYLAGADGHTASEHLHGVGPFALFGGVLLFVLGHLGFRLRNLGTVNAVRVVVAVVLVAETPVAPLLPAWGALLLLTVTCVGWIAVEAVRHGQVRGEVRAEQH